MLISDLEIKLKQLKEKYGDIEVQITEPVFCGSGQYEGCYPKDISEYHFHIEKPDEEFKGTIIIGKIDVDD